jgi:hypothetical protein
MLCDIDLAFCCAACVYSEFLSLSVYLHIEDCWGSLARLWMPWQLINNEELNVIISNYVTIPAAYVYAQLINS